MARKKKFQATPIETRPETSQDSPPPPPRESPLSRILSYFGRDRLAVKELLTGVGIHDSAQAYNFLHSLDRIPPDITLEQFNAIYSELMA